MSITLRQLAYEALRPESGGDLSLDSQLSEKYAILYARQACNAVLRPLMFEQLAGDDRSTLHLMVVRFEVEVKGDAQQKNQYVDLPAGYLHFLFNKGLRGIAPVEDPTSDFIPRHNPAVSRSLPCADLEPGQFSYYTEGLKAYFDVEIPYVKVLIKLVIGAPDTIGEDDPLPMYPEQQFQVVAMVRQMLRDQPLQDKLLDNNSDRGVKIAQ